MTPRSPLGVIFAEIGARHPSATIHTNMKPLNQPNVSFILRIWWEEEEAGGGRHFWRGWVQHVRSGESTYVQDLESLLDFIERWAGRLRPADDQERRNHD